MENNILIQDFVKYDGKNCILSTAELPGNTPIYETILCRKDFSEIDIRRTTEEAAAIRLHLASAEKLRDKTTRADGAAVGMLFYVQWGYEQTNTTFFQIVQLIGRTSARVRRVRPEVIEERANSSMSAYYTYKNSREILEPFSNSWIDDAARGDIHRIRKDTNGLLYFTISDYWAHEYTGRELYDSWYY